MIPSIAGMGAEFVHAADYELAGDVIQLPW
jgi:hypothetical protein